MFSNTAVPNQRSRWIVERTNQSAFFIGLILTGTLGLLHCWKIKSAFLPALLVLFTILIPLGAKRGFRSQRLVTLLLTLSFFEWLYLYGEIGPIACLSLFSMGLLSLPLQRQHTSLSCGILWNTLSLLHASFAKSPEVIGEIRIFSESAQPLIFWFAASLLPIRQAFNRYSLVGYLLLAFVISIMGAIIRHEYFYYFREVDLSQIGHPVYLSGIIVLCGALALLAVRHIWSSVQKRAVWEFTAASILFGIVSCSILTLWTRELVIPSFGFIQNFPTNISFLILGDPGLMSHLRPPTMEHRAGLSLLLHTTGIGGMIVWVWTVTTAQRPLLFKFGVLLVSLIPGFFSLAIFPFVLSLSVPLHRATPVQREAPFPSSRQVGVLVCAVVLVLSFLLVVSLSQRRNQENKSLALTSVPEHLIEQLLVAEDLLFLTHQGIDFARLKWVVRDTLTSGRFDRGASTLTMQLAKIHFLSYDKTILRKLQQILVALYLEGTTSKKSILEEYLSAVSFGPHVIGLENAAQHYFSKHPSALTEREALLLILTIENPERFTPAVHPVPKAIRQRAQAIIRNRRLFSSTVRAQIRTTLHHD